MEGTFVSSSIGEGSVLLRVSFPHDLAASEQERASDELVAAGEAAIQPVVVVDLSGVDTAYSRFLAALLTLLRNQRRRGGRVLLSSVRPLVAQALERCALDVLFESFSSVEEALEARDADST